MSPRILLRKFQMWVGVILIAMACVTALLPLFVLVQARQAGTWPSVSGRVIGTSVTPVETKDAPLFRTEATFEPRIEYEYLAAGHTYRANQYYRNGPISYRTRAEAEAFAARFPVGTKVTVHYDPDRPETAVLDTAPGPYALFHPLSVAVFPFMFGLLVIAHYWWKWGRKNRAERLARAAPPVQSYVSRPSLLWVPPQQFPHAPASPPLVGDPWPGEPYAPAGYQPPVAPAGDAGPAVFEISVWAVRHYVFIKSTAGITLMMGLPLAGMLFLATGSWQIACGLGVPVGLVLGVMLLRREMPAWHCRAELRDDALLLGRRGELRIAYGDIRQIKARQAEVKRPDGQGSLPGRSGISYVRIWTRSGKIRLYVTPADMPRLAQGLLARCPEAIMLDADGQVHCGANMHDIRAALGQAVDYFRGEVRVGLLLLGLSVLGALAWAGAALWRPGLFDGSFWGFMVVIWQGLSLFISGVVLIVYWRKLRSAQARWRAADASAAAPGRIPL